MVYLHNFETEFKGKKFKSDMGVEYTCIGYGDNDSNGNPYLIGVNDKNGRIVIRTILFKNLEFVP